MKNSRSFASAISIFALLASAGLANAHSSLEQSEAKAGGFYKAIVRIPHGCEGKATTAVKIELPEGFVSAQPQPKAGWKVETAKGDYAQSYKIHGKDVTSGVKRVEIHEMSMENQVMKMRKLDGGLDIPAGETVELKSGGYHLMFIQPEQPYKEGDKVSATLEFEKAGKVDLEFPVTPQSGKSDDHSKH